VFYSVNPIEHRRDVPDVSQYEHLWCMAYLRVPEGIIVSLAERIG